MPRDESDIREEAEKEEAEMKTVGQQKDISTLSLAGMLVDTFLIWRQRIKAGAVSEVPRKLHLYSRFAYIWWILAFISGGALVLFS